MYDVVVIGAGPAGLFACYELIENNPKLKVLLIDKGKLAEKRVCPMNKNKNGICLNCNPCNILSGYGGAGTFSDGKLNFIPRLGKSNLFKYMEQSKAKVELCKYAIRNNIELDIAQDTYNLINEL